MHVHLIQDKVDAASCQDWATIPKLRGVPFKLSKKDGCTRRIGFQAHSGIFSNLPFRMHLQLGVHTFVSVNVVDIRAFSIQKGTMYTQTCTRQKRAAMTRMILRRSRLQAQGQTTLVIPLCHTARERSSE